MPEVFFSCCWQRKLSGEAAIGWRRTDVNLFTGVIETLLKKFAIPQFDNISRPFYTSLPHVHTCQVTKTNRSHKKPAVLASYLVSKSHGSAVCNCRDQRGFFPLVTRSRLRRSIFAANNRKRNPLAPRIPRPRITRKIKWLIGHLQSGVILLLRPEFFSFFLSNLNFIILARFK